MAGRNILFASKLILIVVLSISVQKKVFVQLDGDSIYCVNERCGSNERNLYALCKLELQTIKAMAFAIEHRGEVCM